MVGKDIKSIQQKEKCNQLDYIEIKNFSTKTNNSEKVKWKKVFNIYIHPAGFVSRKFHVLPQINKKKIDPQHRKIGHKT